MGVMAQLKMPAMDVPDNVFRLVLLIVLITQKLLDKIIKREIPIKVSPFIFFIILS